MSFTTELQDLKTKIEALIAAGGTIEPALINQLAAINQALDQGSGGGGGGSARYVYEVAVSVTRPADTTAYAVGDAIGSGTSVIVFESVGATDCILLGLELRSLNPIDGDVSVFLSKNSLPANTDNNPAVIGSYDYHHKFLSSEVEFLAGQYRLYQEVCVPILLFDNDHFIHAQFVASSAFTPSSSQVFYLSMKFVDA